MEQKIIPKSTDVPSQNIEIPKSKNVIEENEEKHLKYYSDSANNSEKLDKMAFIDLSLYQIAKNIAKTFNECLNELLKLDSFNYIKIYKIVTKEDRLIYLGIILIFISICFFLI